MSKSVIKVNDIDLSYDDYGFGGADRLITGSGARARMRMPHLVPALIAAGCRAITVDNRGIPSTDAGLKGNSVDDMVEDVAGLIAALGIGPCRIAGYSLDGIIVQELLLTHPDLIAQAVLMAMRGRTDVLSVAISDAESELLDSGIVLPLKYVAACKLCNICHCGP
jgi:pimeloyl-ACP methyl ester carboxylesterase